MCLRFVLAALVLVATACSSEPPRGRVIVVGLDGMDPQAVDLLMSEGKMPNFARMRRGGAYGRLESRKPLLSPVVWTTVATGKTPDLHGIGHFVAVNEKTGGQLPATSQMRAVKALWNILSDAGREVAVVGWWATWPAEAVRGAVVSDHTCYHFLFEEGFGGATDSAGIVHPPALLSEIQSMVRRPEMVTHAQLARFVDVKAEELERPFTFEDELAHFRWALGAALTYRDVGLHLWKSVRPEVALVYVEAPDSTSHLFGH
jgi:predicted AlkP superfamily pyrophosphatase or phosphodiesterase